ncbi:uncharacterized protein LAJ45_10559 [Morchella importuna]|uniref:CNVH-domain-containing protein n=1 Tax=Morchella conica CCBAS932 TaxID=1392247 RepID=A0A3N4KWD3_9PEZI|nr:uncharacterized protein LAJ45_10559 [Morchella importuna]KAH8145437.1 hypothetical protein LAJ45_10559 [Morchella importuna]RPB12661.1 CNVH-domain-containing protein [Morchella conica CCBAS932]
MSFSETTRYHQLIDGRILEAECLNEYGDWVRSAIDLNNYIGNINGTLEWDSAGFFDTAVNVNLVEFGRRLEAVLVRESGMEDICGLWLDERISNINGELVYQGGGGYQQGGFQQPGLGQVIEDVAYMEEQRVENDIYRDEARVEGAFYGAEAAVEGAVYREEERIYDDEVRVENDIYRDEAEIAAVENFRPEVEVEVDFNGRGYY